MADASPQAGEDYLLSTLLSVQADSLVQLSSDIDCVSASGEAFIAAFNSEDQEEQVRVIESRRLALDNIHNAFHWHRLPPMGLGSGRTSVVYKFRAICKALYLETQSISRLADFMSSVYGFTTDLGTEAITKLVAHLLAPQANLAEVSGITLKDILPEGMVDVLEPDANPGGAASAELPASSHAFPNAVWVPGAAHIGHNLTEAVDKNLVHFGPWLEKLKALNMLWSHQTLRRRYVAACLLGKELEDMSHFVDAGTQAIAEWRWNSIIDVLEVLLPLQSLLHSSWNESAFARHEHSDDGADPIATFSLNQFKLHDVTAAIKNPSWWCYSRMICELNNTSANFVSYLEGCPCHGWLQRGACRQQAERLQQLRKELGCTDANDGLGHIPCPLAGMKAMDLALGDSIKEHFEHHHPDLVRRILGTHVAGVAAADLEHAVSDYHAGIHASMMITKKETPLIQLIRAAKKAQQSPGRQHMLALIQLKLHIWSQPPWCMAALASSDTQLARSRAREMLAQFDSRMESTQERGQPIRAELDAFVRGTPLADLLALQRVVCTLRLLPTVRPQNFRAYGFAKFSNFWFLPHTFEAASFVPSAHQWEQVRFKVERRQEADHSLINRMSAKRKVSAAYIANVLRVPEVEKLFAKPAECQRYLQHLQDVRKLSDMAVRLGFARHPLWIACVRANAPYTQRVQLAMRIVYSIAPQEQYADLREVL
eukprot:6051464-Amphidinium_carterae.2